MAKGDPSSTISSSSFWSRLPADIQHSILSLLPVSTLIRCTVVSKAWRSLIQSDGFTTFYSSKGDDDVHFILFSNPANKSLAYSYNPSLNRWFSTLHLNIPLYSHTVVASISSFLIAGPKDYIPSQYSYHIPMIVNPFTGSTFHRHAIPYSLFSDVLGPDVSSCNKKRRFVDDFLSGFGFRRQFVDGLLVGLRFMPGPDVYRLVVQDGERLMIREFDAHSPPCLACHELLVFDGRLFLVGGLTENNTISAEIVIVRVGIWELHREKGRSSSRMEWSHWENLEWRLVCYMPDEVFDKFSVPRLIEFRIASQKGKICFHNTFASIILMCDLSTMTWWWPPPPPQRLLSDIPRLYKKWVGYSVEPHIDLVKQVLIGRKSNGSSCATCRGDRGKEENHHETEKGGCSQGWMLNFTWPRS